MADQRDLRDPQKLGEALQKQAPMVRATYGKDIPLSEVYDVHVGLFNIPAYPQDESCATVTAREYRAELQEAAEKGDKYAASRLAGLDEGSGAGGDPAGS